MEIKYVIYKEYVKDSGLGIDVLCDSEFIDVFDNLKEATKEFHNYLKNNASEHYTYDNHPLDEKFIELNLVKEVLVDYEKEDWEIEEFILVKYYK